MRTSRPCFNFFYRKFVFRRNSLLFKILSAYLLPFTLFYLLIVLLRRIFTTPERFEFPVISVGNIISGGTGKTTLVMSLVKTLEDAGKKILVLSSGVSVAKKGCLKTGDEIYMMGKNFPGLTFASKNAREIKRLIEKASVPYDIAIIDDGFHCHHIYKNLNFLLLDMSNPFDNNIVIPSGLLREPKRSIKRADIFILTHPHMVSTQKAKQLKLYLNRYGKSVFVMDYEIECLKNSEKEIHPHSIYGKNIIAVAGIGNPLNFFHLLLKSQPEKIYAVIYPDHFHYSDSDINELRGLYLKKGSDYIVTTEKDYVKLEGRYPPELPLLYLKIRNIITDAGGAEKDFDALLSEML